MWVAKRILHVGSDIRNIGDPVPEAEEWPRVEAWERFGFIEWVEKKETPKKKAPAKVQRRE